MLPVLKGSQRVKHHHVTTHWQEQKTRQQQTQEQHTRTSETHLKHPDILLPGWDILLPGWDRDAVTLQVTGFIHAKPGALKNECTCSSLQKKKWIRKKEWVHGCSQAKDELVHSFFHEYSVHPFPPWLSPQSYRHLSICIFVYLYSVYQYLKIYIVTTIHE
jgi:hypothetical protein